MAANITIYPPCCRSGTSATGARSFCYNLLIFTLGFLLISTNLFAHGTGVLQGRITEAENGAGLYGANVVLEGTVLGASGGPDGYYKIGNIPEGEYAVVISYIGYQTVRDTVTIHEKETVTLNVDMELGVIELSSVMAEAERPYSAASSRAVRQIDLLIRPRRSSQDMIQLAPGVIIAQHGGGGKAEQIFIRGFDCDHGTDVALFADGIPVNMVTHGHGQGYADMHFMIPEIVDELNVFKGPYFARFGNFSTGGALTFSTKDHLEHSNIRLEVGEFNTRKLTTVLQIPGGSISRNAYFAGEFYGTDGPFESPQNFERFNLFGKFHLHLSANSKLSLAMDAFSSGWNQSGQIPERAVKDGTITRFGAIDDLEGGTTSRQNLNLRYSMGEGTEDEFIIQGYGSRYNFKLFSNFTFFLNDSIFGDMIEQTDTRNIAGLNTIYRFRRYLGHTLSTSTIGGGFRNDNIDVALIKSPDRIRFYPKTDARVFERNFYMWIEQEFVFNPIWRLQFGLRGDYFTFNVDNNLENVENPENEVPNVSGYHQQTMLNPKFNLVYSPFPSTDLFLNIGSGFHSNDARNVVTAQRMKEIENSLQRRGFTPGQIDSIFEDNHFDPEQKGIKTLPRAIGLEFGLRSNITPQFVIGLAGWYIHLEEELVFVGDEGTTEINGETQRIGIDIETRYQIYNWFWLDADLNLSHGEFVNEPDGANDIPLAPRVTSTGGLTAFHPPGWDGTIRYRYVGDRPANEFNTVTAYGYTVFTMTLGYRFGPVRVFAHLENILDEEWNEAQFDTESRLFDEPTSVSELHFTPGNPQNVRVGIEYRF
jgi:hypothetical protein